MPNLSQTSIDMTVNLKFDGELKAGQPNTISFEVIDSQGLIRTTDVGVMSGFYINLYIVDEKLSTFIHPELVDRNNLQYSIEFPRSGRYKAWFEFTFAGRRKYQVAYVIDVQ